jgi:hypothetical protein
MCRVGGLLATLALVLLIIPARAGAPDRALQAACGLRRTGDAQPDPALRAWLERRGIAYHVTWIGLAVEINEAKLEALAERDDMLLIRTPLPSEPLPELDAAPSTARVWLPLVEQWCQGTSAAYRCARAANPQPRAGHDGEIALWWTGYDQPRQ